MAAKADKKTIYTNVHGGRLGPRQQSLHRAQSGTAQEYERKFRGAVSSGRASQAMGMVSRMGSGGGGMIAAPTPRSNSSMAKKAMEVLYVKPQVSRLSGLTADQNAQLTRDSVIRSMRQNQKVAAGIVDRQAQSESAMANTVQRGQNSLANTALQNSNSIANTVLQGKNQRTAAAVKGDQDRITLGVADKYERGRDEQKNRWAKQKDNRSFVTQALTRGVPMDAQAQNAYNTPGSHDIDINGMQVPQKQAPAPKQIYVKPQFDKDGSQRPGTGIWTSPPGGLVGQEGAVSGLSSGFDPMKPTPEDEAYLRNLAATGQYDLLRQIEVQYRLGR